MGANVSLKSLVHFLALRVAPILSVILLGLVAFKLSGVNWLAALDIRSSATLSALLFAVFSFFYRSEETERQSRKQHTIKILFDTRLSAEFRQHLERRSWYFPEGTEVSVAKFKRCLKAPTKHGKPSPNRQSAEALRALLNYYEFIALGLKTGDLDEDMMKGSIRGIMCRLVADSVLVIRWYRTLDQRTFQHVTELYEKWKDADQPEIPDASAANEHFPTGRFGLPTIIRR